MEDGKMSDEQRKFVLKNNPELLEDEEFKFVDYFKKVTKSQANIGAGEGEEALGEGEGEHKNDYDLKTEYPAPLE
jgi:hypothetical protein